MGKHEWTDPSKYLDEIHAALDCHPAFMVEEIQRLRDETEEALNGHYEALKRISAALGIPSDSGAETIIESARSYVNYVQSHEGL
jgi:hypothetical protein